MRLQLRRYRSIRESLTAVTATLVGVSSAAATGLDHSETSMLIYSERDRVRATETMFSLDKQMNRGYSLNLRFTYDGLTGASPTGGSPSKYPQTITRPSGGGRVVVAAGELPVDNSFGETRFAADATLSRGVGAGTKVSGGVHLSSEHDYKSIGLSGSVTKDLDSARTTLGLALSVLRDVSSPIGGIPKPLGDITDEVETQNGRRVRRGNGHKRVYDAVASLTRVLGPGLLARFSYTFDRSEGYLTDPYKIISVVQPMDSADPGGIAEVRANIAAYNPNAIVIDAASPIQVDKPEIIRGKKVLVVEDGPTLTHGEMQYGAGVVAAGKYGASELVDPRPYTVRSITSP